MAEHSFRDASDMDYGIASAAARKPKLSNGGYVYRKDREKNDKTQKTIWRCVLRRGCPGRAFTKWSDTDQCTIAVVTKEHSHPPDPSLPDELVESFEVRKSAPVSSAYEHEHIPRPRVDASTSTQPPSHSQSSSQEPSYSVHESMLKRKRKADNYPADLDFDAELNVHFPMDSQNSNLGYHGMGVSASSSSTLHPSNGKTDP